jgi:hypothetical protein
VNFSKNHRASNPAPKAAHYLELLLLEYNLRKCILFKDDSMIKLHQGGCFRLSPHFKPEQEKAAPMRGLESKPAKPIQGSNENPQSTWFQASCGSRRQLKPVAKTKTREGGDKESDKKWRPSAEAGTEEKAGTS